MSNQIVNYKFWKNGLYKWDSWVANRHNKTKICDNWSKFIIDKCGTSKTAIIDSGGLFFTDFMKNIEVIEFDPCPIPVPGMKYIQDGIDYYQEFDNLVMINPIAVKLNTSILNFLTVPGLSRRGQKPKFIDWLKPGGKIFLSTSDWHLCYDRLRFTPHTMIDQQLEDLKQANITCIYREIGLVNDDIENGNIKLVLALVDSI